MEKDEVIIRFVKKANMWCATYWDKDKQERKWFSTLPEAMKFRDEWTTTH